MIQITHNLPLIGHHTLFATLKESLLFHEFEGIEFTSGQIPGEKNPGESPRANTLDDLKVWQLYGLLLRFPPNGFYLQNLPFKHFKRFCSLKVIVFKDVSRSYGPPSLDAVTVELGVF